MTSYWFFFSQNKFINKYNYMKVLSVCHISHGRYFFLNFFKYEKFCPTFTHIGRLHSRHSHYRWRPASCGPYNPTSTNFRLLSTLITPLRLLMLQNCNKLRLTNHNGACRYSVDHTHNPQIPAVTELSFR